MYGPVRTVLWADGGHPASSDPMGKETHSGVDIPVFLLNVFSKGDKVNLTMAERNELKKILGSVARAYRERK